MRERMRVRHGVEIVHINARMYKSLANDKA